MPTKWRDWKTDPEEWIKSVQFDGAGTDPQHVTLPRGPRF